MKRLFDIIVSTLGILLLSPIGLLVAAIIKFDSKGPVLFRQERIGRHGQPFLIFKFRTMSVDAAANGPQVTGRGDLRITRVGSTFRKYKIDEFPQLLNVLRGDMSMVGPRPEVRLYIDQYPEFARRLILSVRPGITDLASIKYRNEETLLALSSNPEQTYINEVLPEKIRYYLDYVKNRTFVFDLMIIALTLLEIFE